jgi:hypothetical protein
MLLATAYVLLAGSYLEWCMILRARYDVRPAPLTDRILQVGACNPPGTLVHVWMRRSVGSSVAAARQCSVERQRSTTCAAIGLQSGTADIDIHFNLCKQAARALRKGVAGGAKAHRGITGRLTGFKVRTLAQLVHWGAGMAAVGLLLVVLLESTRGNPEVLNFSDYMKV